MDEKEFRLEVRLLAIEHILTRCLAIQAAHLSEPQFQQLRETWTAGIYEESFPGLPAEQGDLWSAEIAEQVQELLRKVSDIHTDLRSKL